MSAEAKSTASAVTVEFRADPDALEPEEALHALQDLLEAIELTVQGDTSPEAAQRVCGLAWAGKMIAKHLTNRL